MQDRQETYETESERENHQAQASQDFLNLRRTFHLPQGFVLHPF